MSQYWNGVGELQSRQEFGWVLRKDYDPDGGWIDARPGGGLPPSGTITLYYACIVSFGREKRCRIKTLEGGASETWGGCRVYNVHGKSIVHRRHRRRRHHRL